MFNTIDYIKGIIESMNFDEPISNIIYDNATKTTTFDTCKTFWVFECYKIKINNSFYEVVDSEINMSITVKGEVNPNATFFHINAPFFYHGTPLQTAIQLATEEKYWLDKLPFVYLIEPMTETRDLSRLRVLDRTSQLNLLFMLPGALKESVLTQYQTAIKPTDNMVFEWEKKIMLNPNIAELSEAKSKNRVNYGVWVSKNPRPKPTKEDNIMKLINEAISGIEYSISIPFKREVCDLDLKCKTSFI
jgi:hypothetical protein